MKEGQGSIFDHSRRMSTVKKKERGLSGGYKTRFHRHADISAARLANPGTPAACRE